MSAPQVSGHTMIQLHTLTRNQLSYSHLIRQSITLFLMFHCVISAIVCKHGHPNKPRLSLSTHSSQKGEGSHRHCVIKGSFYSAPLPIRVRYVFVHVKPVPPRKFSFVGEGVLSHMRASDPSHVSVSTTWRCSPPNVSHGVSVLVSMQAPMTMVRRHQIK